MATKEDKLRLIRTRVINAANIYSNELAGKMFLYVYGNEFFELLFPTDRFMHLTGITSSSLTPSIFYQKSLNHTITTQQLGMSYYEPDGTLVLNKRNFAIAKEKLPSLILLPSLTKEIVCILKNMSTATCTYTIGVSNLDFTLGLHSQGTLGNNIFIPRTLRVRDNSIERSSDGEIVDFIFMKDASGSKYSTIMYSDTRKMIPDCVEPLLDSTLLA